MYRTRQKINIYLQDKAKNKYLFTGQGQKYIFIYRTRPKINIYVEDKTKNKYLFTRQGQK